MPANTDFPVLDGVAPSWADINVKIGGSVVLDVKDIKSINTSIAVEVGEQLSGGRVIKTTAGSEKCEASLTLYRLGYQKLIRAMQAVAPTRGSQKLVSLVHFDIQILHTPEGDTEIYEVRIKGCRLTGRALNSAEGNDADTVDVSLHVKAIVDVIDGVEVSHL